MLFSFLQQHSLASLFSLFSLDSPQLYSSHSNPLPQVVSFHSIDSLHSTEPSLLSFWVGLFVSVVTNLVQAFCLAYQRKSHLANDSLPKEARRSAYRRPLWAAAFGMYLVANITGSVFSIGYLPVVILAPIGAMNLVFNVMAANVVLGDPLSRRSVIGTVLIVAGALLVGGFGVLNEPNHSLEDLIQLYKKPGFIVYFSILESAVVVTMLLTHTLDYVYCQWEDTVSPPHPSLLLDRWVCLEDLKRYVGMSYGILGGNISSQSLLFAKSGVELLILTLVYHDNQLHHALTWILLVMMVATAVLQLFYLNKGLRLCDTVVLVPLSFCAFNVSTLFNGVVYYDQWDRLQWWQWVLVLLGVVLTMHGVVLLSTPTAEKDATETTRLLMSPPHYAGS
ncbi:hypothetical protein BDF14DRAFT_1736850 [Spinellus fusiger]|nr:hypothetical protein BDF14DRAFT_1736850 [Spinellus fusiger]